MDILSLPNEMLASVLKYSTFADLTKMRKASSKVDSVAKKYHLDNVKAESLSFSSNRNFLEVWLNCTGWQTTVQRHNADSFVDVMRFYFRKIRNLKYLGISSSRGEEIFICNEVAELILGTTCRKLTNLLFMRVKLMLSFELMRSVLTKLKLKEIRITLERSEFELSDKLIDGLELDSFTLVNHRIGTTISLIGLETLCVRRLPRQLFVELHNSTVIELGQFFEKYMVDPLPTRIKWRIHISKGEIGKEEILPYFSGLKCFKNLKFNFSNNGFMNALTISNEIKPMEKVNVRINILIY